jgi:hypothetical protein
LNALEDYDDVQNVFHDADLPEERKKTNSQISIQTAPGFARGPFQRRRVRM